MSNATVATALKMPKNLDAYRGQFIVFFPQDADPQVRFESVIGSEAYAYADKITKETGRTPVVHRVALNESESLMQLLATRG